MCLLTNTAMQLGVLPLFPTRLQRASVVTFGFDGVDNELLEVWVMPFQVGLNHLRCGVVYPACKLVHFRGDGIQPALGKDLATVTFCFQLATLLLSNMSSTGYDKLVMQR